MANKYSDGPPPRLSRREGGLKNRHAGRTEKSGIGAMTDARVQDFYDKMVKAKVLPAGVDIKKGYTLDFVNKGVGLELKK